MKKDLILLFSSDLAFILSGFIVNIFLANRLSVEIFAVASLLITTMTAIRLIFASGYPKVVSVKIALSHTAGQDEKSISFTSLVVQTVLILILSPIIILLTRNFLLDIIPVRPVILWIIALNIVFISMFSHLHIAIANGFKNFTLQSFSKLIIGISKLVFILSIVWIWGTVESLFWSFFISYLVTDLLVVYTLRDYFNFSLNLGLIKAEFIRYIKALPLSFSAIFSYFLITLYIYVVRFVYDDIRVVGYYSASTIITTGVVFLTRSLSAYIRPSASESDTVKMNETVLRDINQLITAIFGLQFLIVAGAAIFNSIIFWIMYPPAYGIAVILFIYLTFASALFALIEILQNLIIAKGKDTIASSIYYIAVIVFVGTIAIQWIVDYKFLLETIAVDLFLSMLVSFLLAVFLTWKYANRHYHAIVQSVPVFIQVVIIVLIRIIDIPGSFIVGIILFTLALITYLKMNLDLVKTVVETISSKIQRNPIR